MRNGDDHLVVGVEILRVELFGSVNDLRAPFVAVFGLHLQQFVLNDLHLQFAAAQHIVEISDLRLQLVALGNQLVVFESRQSTQTHLDNGRSLCVAQTEALHHGLLGQIGILGCPDDVDDLVDVVLRNEQTQHDMQPLLGLDQIEARAPHDHVVAVLDEMPHQIQQIEHHRTTVHQRDVVHRERGLQRRILIQRIEHHARHGIVFQDDDDTHAVPVGLVVDIGNALDLLFVDKVGDLLDHLRLVDHIGNFGDDDALAAAGRMLDLRAGTHDHTAPACQQRFPNPFVAVNNSSGREIGALDVLEQLLTCYLRIVHESTAGIDHLAQIVRRHIGRHTDGDTARAVHQQQGDLRRKHRRFGDRIVEVERPIDRILVDIGHHLIGDLLHAGLGITHRRRRIAVHRTEVTLTVHQRVAHRPILGHTHHRFIDRTVVVRVELTQHVADDTGGFTRGFVGVEVQFRTHIVKNTTVYGLQTVPHVRQRTRYDNGHRIVDVSGLHLLFDIDGNDFSLQSGILFFFCQHVIL